METETVETETVEIERVERERELETERMSFFCSCFRLERRSWLSGCECCACQTASFPPFLTTPTSSPPSVSSKARSQVEPSPKSDTDATRFGDIRMQPSRAEPTLYKVSENCLNLNIVRPQGVTLSFGSTEELSFLVTFPASMLASWCRRVSRLASPLCSSR